MTGATGFLGLHVLCELLNTEASTIYCLVRANNERHALERLRNALHTQFGDTPCAHLGTRILPIVGDLLSLTPSQLPSTIGTVIHCAADTRHFAPDHEIETTNIDGTDRIIDCCVATGARLIHVSTLSVDDASTNAYLHSKAIAEHHIVEATTHRGLKATIVRVGNLTLPNGDVREGLKSAIEAFQRLGQYPQSLATFPIDLAPVDQTARAIVQIAKQTNGSAMLHDYKPYTIPLGELLQQQGGIKPVSDAEFQASLTQALNQPELRPTLVSLLHYQDMARQYTHSNV